VVGEGREEKEKRKKKWVSAGRGEKGKGCWKQVGKEKKKNGDSVHQGVDFLKKLKKKKKKGNYLSLS
jgi:hypothetical protein